MDGGYHKALLHKNATVQLLTGHGAAILCVCRYDRQLLAQVEAAAQEQRLRQGLVRSTVLGPQRAREALVAARDHITSLLKHMVDEVERNHATQVGTKATYGSSMPDSVQVAWTVCDYLALAVPVHRVASSGHWILTH